MGTYVAVHTCTHIPGFTSCTIARLEGAHSSSGCRATAQFPPAQDLRGACTHGDLASSLSLGPKGLHSQRETAASNSGLLKLQRELVAVSLGRGGIHLSFAWFGMLKDYELV